MTKANEQSEAIDAIKQRTAVASEPLGLPATAEQRRCDNCKFYREVSPATGHLCQPFPSEGECRIRSGPGRVWPERKGDDWCGEFMVHGGPVRL